MQLVKNNPYRILGLLAGARIREQTSRTKKLIMYIETDESLGASEDFSFPILGPLNRTIESVTKAAANLSQNQDKIEAALFWFVNAGMLDEPALDHLQEGSESDAATTWSKWAKKEGEISIKNFAAVLNLSTLWLNQAFKQAKRVDPAMLEDGLALKIRFLDSRYFNELVRIACDEHFKISKEKLLETFLDLTRQEAEKQGFSLTKFIKTLQTVDFSTKQAYLTKFAQLPVGEIEQAVEQCRKNRKDSPQYCNQFGKRLFDQTKEPLKQLSTMVGHGDLKFTNSSDNVAEEVLNCAIDFWKTHKDSQSINPGSGSMDCLKNAMAIAKGNVIRQRCQENIENLQRWIDDEASRIHQQKVSGDIQQVVQLIEQYEGTTSIQSARQLLQNAWGPLANVCAHLGSTDDFYLGLSTRVAMLANSLLVDEINEIQEAIQRAYESQKLVLIFKLKASVEAAWEVSNTIGSMDLTADWRKHFNQNKNALSGLRNNLLQISSQRQTSSSSSDGGCYIATMVYGDYDHPQVQVLRRFRDTVLSTSPEGRCFIHLYYRYSPRLVRLLWGQGLVNRSIRFVLDQLIKNIKINQK